MKPTVLTETPRDRMNSGSTGFLAMVELKMASPPVRQRSRNGEILIFIRVSLMPRWRLPLSLVLSSTLLTFGFIITARTESDSRPS